MRILAFCPAALGTEPERARSRHVYRTVLEAFLPLLRELGETIVVRDAQAEVPALQREAQVRGERCLLLCFADPDQIPRGLPCPALSVLLGPFDVLGDSARPGETAVDWRAALAPHGAALALSSAARAVVRTVMGDAFPVQPLAVPLFERFAAGLPARSEPPRGSRRVAVEGRIFDSRDYDFEPERVHCRTPLERYCRRTWSGAREELRFDFAHAETEHLGGFYEPEEWGSWSRIREPWVMLPFPLSGSVKLTLCAAGYGRNANRTIAVEIGGVRRELTLWGRFEELCVSFDLPRPAHLIQFRGIDTDEIPGVGDHRSMGIGLRWMALEGAGCTAELPAPLAPLQEQTVDGVVYVSMDADLSDAEDPIKVWREVVKAFCCAFRDTPDAVLVLHVAHIRPCFFAELHTVLHKAGKIAARILVLHGELDEGRRRALIDASTYYVCAARHEALCLPFKEVLSLGVPALAPEHVYRAELPDADAAVQMRYVAESPGWPVPEWRGARKATRHRADFESVVQCFESSYRIAKEDPSAYARLCRASRESQARSSTAALVRKQLEALLVQGSAAP
jgi:hypothetical protein